MAVEHYSDIYLEIHVFHRSLANKLALYMPTGITLVNLPLTVITCIYLNINTPRVCLDLSLGLDISFIKRLAENVNVAIWG